MAQINKNLKPKLGGRVWSTHRKINLFSIREIRVIRGYYFGFWV